jgi:hypothetical protein
MINMSQISSHTVGGVYPPMRGRKLSALAGMAPTNPGAAGGRGDPAPRQRHQPRRANLRSRILVHPATPASTSPWTSSRPAASYCVTANLARERVRSICLAVAIRTGSPASTS